MKQQTPDTTTTDTKTDPRPEVIATRKTCDASGTGLSHYVLMDQEPRR